MRRKLPIYNLDGNPFIVNVEKDHLCQMNYPHNIIRFADLLDLGTHYLLKFDTVEKCIFDLPWTDEPGRLSLLEVPPLTTLDPEGMAKKYHTTVEGLQGKVDIDLINNSPEVLERLAKGYSEFNVGPHAFKVDVNAMTLTSLESPEITIQLSLLKPLPGRNGWEIHYDPEKDKLYLPYTGDMIMKSDTIQIYWIPPPKILDPIGTAEKCRLKKTEFLRAYPIQKHLEAKLLFTVMNSNHSHKYRPGIKY